jgi:hypothetical protein
MFTQVLGPQTLGGAHFSAEPAEAPAASSRLGGGVYLPAESSEALAASSRLPADDGVGSSVAEGVARLNDFAGLGVAEDVAADWREAADEAEAMLRLPFFNTTTCAVHDGGPDGIKLGRMKPMKEGTPGECMTVYCRRHGCSKIIRTAELPERDRILRWFAEGRAIKFGAEGKHEHMRAFPPKGAA